MHVPHCSWFMTRHRRRSETFRKVVAELKCNWCDSDTQRGQHEAVTSSRKMLRRGHRQRQGRHYQNSHQNQQYRYGWEPVRREWTSITMHRKSDDGGFYSKWVSIRYANSWTYSSSIYNDVRTNVFGDPEWMEIKYVFVIDKCGDMPVQSGISTISRNNGYAN